MSDKTAPVNAQGPTLIRRYGRTQRVAHWWVAGIFALAVATAPEEARGHTLLLVTHIFAASALILGLIAIVIFGNRAALVADVTTLLRFNATDREWIRSLKSVRSSRQDRQPTRWGKFNTGQKAAAWALFALMIGVIVTGAADAIIGHATIHPILMGLVWLALLGHVFMAVVYPATRPSLRGMVRGTVDRSWAERHHGAWVDEVDVT